jgi:hypothetical protein
MDAHNSTKHGQILPCSVFRAIFVEAAAIFVEAAAFYAYWGLYGDTPMV